MRENEESGGGTKKNEMKFGVMRQKRKEDSVERTGGRLPEGVYTGPSLQSRSILYTVYTVQRAYCFVTEKNFLPGRSQSKMIPFLWETWTVSFAFDSSIRTDITWYLILFFFYITKKGIPSIQGRVFFHFWYINLIHSDFEIINATEKEVWWSIHGAKLFFFSSTVHLYLWLLICGNRTSE